MNFELPAELAAYLVELDDFIEREIKPLELEDDNIRFFDHRREDARTDWDRGGLPNEEWDALLAEAVRRADAAGHYRYPAPAQYGGRDGTNLGMAVIREHLAAKGLGLHNDLQNEHSIVGNNISLLLMLHYGSEQQKTEWIDSLANGTRYFAFGITEPEHGSDATHMETTATRDGDEWVINGEKYYISGAGDPRCKVMITMVKTSPNAAPSKQQSQILVPTDAPGVDIVEAMEVFGSDGAPRGHMRILFKDARVPKGNILLGEGRGFEISQVRLGPGRIHHCMRSIGQAEKALELMVKRAGSRIAFGKPIAKLGKNLEVISRARLRLPYHRPYFCTSARPTTI